MPACLDVLIALHGANLPLPGKLIGLMGGKRLVQWFPTGRILLHKLAAGQPVLGPFRLLLKLRHIGALVRDFVAERFRKLFAVDAKYLCVLSPT